MRAHTVMAQAELQPLLELTQRVGSDPLLTQASTGNSSAKLGRCNVPAFLRKTTRAKASNE